MLGVRLGRPREVASHNGQLGGPVRGQWPCFSRARRASLGGQLRRATGAAGHLLGQDRHLRAVAGRFGRDDPVDQAGSQRGGGTDRQARGRTLAANKSFPAPTRPTGTRAAVYVRLQPFKLM